MTYHGATQQVFSLKRADARPYACNVLYFGKRGLLGPWFARRDNDSCEKQARELTKKYVDSGWECVVEARPEAEQAVAHRASSSAAPA